MDLTFILRITFSFFISGFWIAFATLLAERLGSKIGGLITNLPSNILISLLFIAIIKGPSFVVAAIPGIPIGMAINTLFLLVFIISLKYGLVVAIIVSLSAWLTLALMAASLILDNLAMNVIFYFIITAASFILVETIVTIPSKKKILTRYTKIQILIRAFFAGSVVTSVIILSKIFDPLVVGIFSTFPAVLLSTMIILVLNQNKAFAQATGKILVLSSSNIIIYALAVYVTYPRLGIMFGTILSFCSACLWIWLLLPVVQRTA